MFSTCGNWVISGLVGCYHQCEMQYDLEKSLSSHLRVNFFLSFFIFPSPPENRKALICDDKSLESQRTTKGAWMPKISNPLPTVFPYKPSLHRHWHLCSADGAREETCPGAGGGTWTLPKGENRPKAPRSHLLDTANTGESKHHKWDFNIGTFALIIWGPNLLSLSP